MNIFKDIIYNKIKNRFECVFLCDKTGKYGKKLNYKLFKDIIHIKCGVTKPFIYNKIDI